MDELQKFTLDWLKEISATLLCITSSLIEQHEEIYFITDEEQKLLDDLSKHHKKLETFSAREANEIDGRYAETNFRES